MHAHVRCEEVQSFNDRHNHDAPETIQGRGRCIFARIQRECTPMAKSLTTILQQEVPSRILALDLPPESLRARVKKLRRIFDTARARRWHPLEGGGGGTVCGAWTSLSSVEKTVSVSICSFYWKWVHLAFNRRCQMKLGQLGLDSLNSLFFLSYLVKGEVGGFGRLPRLEGVAHPPPMQQHHRANQRLVAHLHKPSARPSAPGNAPAPSDIHPDPIRWGRLPCRDLPVDKCQLAAAHWSVAPVNDWLWRFLSKQINHVLESFRNMYREQDSTSTLLNKAALPYGGRGREMQETWTFPISVEKQWASAFADFFEHERVGEWMCGRDINEHVAAILFLSYGCGAA